LRTNVLLLIALHLAPVAGASQKDCREEEVRAIAAVPEMLSQGDDPGIVAVVERDFREGAARCDAIRLSRSALLGWHEARRLAAKGGAMALLGPVNQYLAELQTITAPALAIEVEYARVAIRAAIAAAQDERPELELLLTQARDLSERLALRQRRAMLPRPVNLLAGELWFEVDRYKEAAAAFERAASFDGAPAAFAGLGRALDALGRRDDACRAYRQVRDGSPALRDEVAAFLAGCP
jgi:tetratricopeptide (TPR) repeat protein